MNEIDDDSVALYEPGVPDTGVWIDQEGARTPVRFRERVIAQFRSPENVQYLRRLFTQRVFRGPLRQFILSTLDDAVYEFSEGEGRGYDVLMSDPLAQRGWDRPAVSLWQEIKRMNIVFFEDRMALLRDQAATIDRAAPRDGIDDDDEPYHIRMFTSDSLRPPGLEHLNTPGPIFALNEDQSSWFPRPDGRWGGAGAGQPGMPDGRRRDGESTLPQHGVPPWRQPQTAHPTHPSRAHLDPRMQPLAQRRVAPQTPTQAITSLVGGSRASSSTSSRLPVQGSRPRVEGFRGRPTDDHDSVPIATSQSAHFKPSEANGDSDIFTYGDDDSPWSRGDPNRTPEQAMAEYQGSDWSPTDTIQGSAAIMGQTNGAVYSWGNSWQDNGGTEFMRYKSIPYWQKGGREGYDYDIEECLGSAARETDNPVYRQDMDILRNPRGQEYRRFGARNGHIV